MALPVASPPRQLQPGLTLPRGRASRRAQPALLRGAGCLVGVHGLGPALPRFAPRLDEGRPGPQAAPAGGPATNGPSGRSPAPATAAGANAPSLACVAPCAALAAAGRGLPCGRSRRVAGAVEQRAAA